MLKTQPLNTNIRNTTTTPGLTFQPEFQVHVHKRRDKNVLRAEGAICDNQSKCARSPGYLVLLHCESATGIREYTHTRAHTHCII